MNTQAGMAERRRKTWLFFAAMFTLMLALRLCHAHILWADEDYHIAAGLETLRGKMLYRDLWYDKPPLGAWLYAALGAPAGWPLRVFDAVWLLAICAATWRFARDLWGRREAFVAAGLMAFFLNFDFPSAVIPAAPDLLLLLPHILAAHSAWMKRPFRAGLWCGIGFLFHTKGIFVLAACALICWPALPLLLAGFAIPNTATLAVLGAAGALPAYLEQVWRWGWAYAGSSPEPQPLLNAARRVMDWGGFHATLVLGAALFGWRARSGERLRLAAWLALAFAGVALGGRFFPRYFLLLLPPLVLMWGGRDLHTRFRYTMAAMAICALLVPLVRFAPRYFLLAFEPDAPWADIALDRDSQAVAARVDARKEPGDTLFLWGYRPGVFVYTRLPAASKYWDSQPLTGVPADRHLRESASLNPQWAARNRQELAAARPEFIVDSLSLENPKLGIETYPELREWLAGYRLVARTRLSLVYRKNASAPR